MEKFEVRAILERCSDLVMENLQEILALRYDIRYKPDGSPVTEADIFVENRVSTYLKSVIPGLIFVGEESFEFDAVDQLSTIALLDPIDGTENFCSGLKEWGVSLGIWQGGQHLGSMLLMPELAERLITGDTIVSLRSRITGFSSSYHGLIASGIRDAPEYRVTGCAVYNLFNVARGAFSRFCNPKGAYAWDLLPGLMIALENNCTVLVNDEPYFGEFLQPNLRYRVDVRHG